MPVKQSIPLHYLSEETSKGVFLHRIDQLDAGKVAGMEVHRDNHCNFFFQERGDSRFMVDFREVSLTGCGVFCILPGQVHTPLSVENASGWLLAIDLISLGDTYREVFEAYAAEGLPVKLNELQSAQLASSLRLLSEFSARAESTPFHQPVLDSMLQVCLGLFAAFIQDCTKQENIGNSRPALITREFKSLLAKNFRTIKSPSEYAQLLNISPSYLTEIVKVSTGFPVSHWIHREVMMEARRLLYFTDLSVKEIAFSLGYEDHTYFSRLFKKVITVSPGQFRSEYRK